MNDDGIDVKLRLHVPMQRWRVRIGDDLYEFPEGTTREQAQAAVDEGKKLYLRTILVGQLRQLARPRR